MPLELTSFKKGEKGIHIKAVYFFSFYVIIALKSTDPLHSHFLRLWCRFVEQRRSLSIQIADFLFELRGSLEILLLNAASKFFLQLIQGDTDTCNLGDRMYIGQKIIS